MTGMESTTRTAIHRIPRSEYLPATPKPTTEKTSKGKSAQPSDDVKNLNVNKSLKVSRIPKQSTLSSRLKKDNKLDKKNTARAVRNSTGNNNKNGTHLDEKQKLSHIPRPRPVIKEPSLKEVAVDPIEISQDSSPIDHQNFQRVQHFNIDTDFYAEHQSNTTSKAKPIPTFGIYKHNYITDWLLDSVSELINISDNSFLSVPRIIEITEVDNEFRIPSNHIIVDSTGGTDSETLEIGPRGTFKTTNENVNDWLAKKIEHTPKDNESGYTSMTAPSKVTSSVNLKNIENFKLQLSSANMMNKSVSSVDISGRANKDSLLTKHETVIMKENAPECHVPQSVYQTIPKINTDFKQIPLHTDLRKNIKFPSTPNPVRYRENLNSIPVPSYVECLSEVIQKTTNFEGIDVLSSVAETDVNTCVDTSQCALEQMDGDTRSVLDTEECFRDTWRDSMSQPSMTQLNLSKTSEMLSNSTLNNHFNERRYRVNNDSIWKLSDNYNYHDFYHHYRWRKNVIRKFDDLGLRGHKGRSLKCKKWRRSSKNNKVSPFENFRKRISIGRICQPKWKGVWKKTAERWSSWTKSPTKFRKRRAKHCFHSIDWDTVDVQTTIYVYREMGTDAAVKEQKSVEITASFKLRSWTSVYNKVEADLSRTSSKTNNSYVSHPNVGPSIFPFLCGTNSSIIQKCVNLKRQYDMSQDTINYNTNINDKETKDATTDPDPEPRTLHKSTSFIINYITSDIGIETDPVLPLRSTLNSTILYSNHTRTSLPRTETQNTYTEKLVACHNAATSMKFIPNIVTASVEQSFFQGSTKSRSGASNTETHGTPVDSIKATDVGAMPSNQVCQCAKPSVFTDTTKPCRKIPRREFSTMLTPKGTILSCTGTKITSVSSTSIDIPFVVPTQSAVVSTTVPVINVDCITAKSLLDRGRKDFSLEFSPEYNSAITNTITEVMSKSAGRTCSEDSAGRFTNNVNRVDAFVQNSGLEAKDYNYKNLLHQSACIGHSQLMSMRMLSNSGTEAEIQAQPELLSAETRTTPRHHMSTSAFTSHCILREPVSPVMMVHKQTGDIEYGSMLDRGCGQVRSSQNQRSYPSENSLPVTSTCNPSNAAGATVIATHKDIPAQVIVTKSKSCTASNNYQPNTVISSNLNAAKWMKGYQNNVEKDFQSIVNVSHSAVSESLERASLILENSIAQIEATMKLAQGQARNDPATNCVTTLAAVSKESLLDQLPTRELSKPTHDSINQAKNDLMQNIECKMVDKITSDKILPKELKETIIQACPNVRSSGFDCIPLPVTEHRSASALTSRFILPDPVPCTLKKQFGSLQTDCIFVYEHPRCIVHKKEDAATQKECCANRESKGAMTSHAPRCQRRTSDLVGEVLVPRVTHDVNRCSTGVGASQAGTFPRSRHQHPDDLIERLMNTNDNAKANYNIGGLTPAAMSTSMTPQSRQQSCQRQASDLIGELLTPRAYKAMYETTKSLMKGKSIAQTPPDYAPPRDSNSEKGNVSTSSKRLQARWHCCCQTRRHNKEKESVTRSTQAILEDTQSQYQNGGIPHGCVDTLDISQEHDPDNVEEYIKSYVTSSCRYYSNLLTKQLDRVKENLKNHIAPPTDAIYKQPSICNMVVEACTMKPSGRQDHCCQTTLMPQKLEQLNKLLTLTSALSAIDFRESRDKQDLKTIYHILSSIEGRVHRLKSNLPT